MIKCYEFIADNKIDEKELIHLCAKIYSGYLEWNFIDEYSGYIFAEHDFFDVIQSLLAIINDDLHFGLSVCCMHTHCSYSKLIVLTSFKYYKLECVHLSDLFFECIMHQDVTFLKEISKMFEPLDRDLLNTAFTYVMSGMSSMVSAKKLYIHRNTFAYRLNKINELLNLDIKDYHNAQLLYYYIRYNKIMND